ncbi:SigE family RNA polymerase sigma factor [Nocardioides aestuarii]|uniref:SigE family RNA polymerase sigma factor n=1 Tax=Nocardioides aestuarii TaxID=252231 RepID=A0ABW4TQH9_9ACTN
MRRADEAAFEEFAVAAQSRLRSTAYLMCGDWHHASDLVQDTLVRLYVAWPRLQRQGAELAYARRTMLNLLLDQRRRRSSGEVPRAEDDTRPSGEDVAEAVSTRAALLATLDRLPPRQRACVVLRYFDDLSVADTAAALGCTEGTVKSQTARGLDALRALVAETSLADLRIG